MIDTEITKIVRNLIKRLEEQKMNATSTENFHDVIAIDLELQTFPNPDVQDKFIVSATNRDDIFCFVFEGPHIEDACRKAGLFTSWEKDQKIRELEEKVRELENQNKKILNTNRKLKEEIFCKDHTINELKQKLQQAEHDKRKYLEKLNKQLKDKKEEYEEKIKNLKHADMLDKGAADYWSKEHDTLSERFAKLQEENEKLKDELEQENKTKCENCLAGASLVDDYFKLAKKNEQLIFEKEMIKKENDKLKKELALEKAANEAQRKFVQSYAGKGTEVQFNYAIDDVKEVSYVIVDKEEYNKNFEKWLNAQVENAPASTSRADILDQAKKCVCGQREQDYGTPESNFQLIADLWTDYLYPTLGYPKKDAYGIKSEDVAMMMALMKIARIRNGGGSGDSFVDLAGYAACGGEIWHGQKAKDQN